MAKGSFKRFQQARRNEWLMGTLTDVARLEGRLGLMTEAQRAQFYGEEYLDPGERLSKLLAASAEAGV